jgi:hypothetical protein
LSTGSGTRKVWKNKAIGKSGVDEKRLKKIDSLPFDNVDAELS